MFWPSPSLLSSRKAGKVIKKWFFKTGKTITNDARIYNPCIIQHSFNAYYLPYCIYCIAFTTLHLMHCLTALPYCIAFITLHSFISMQCINLQQYILWITIITIQALHYNYYITIIHDVKILMLLYMLSQLSGTDEPRLLSASDFRSFTPNSVDLRNSTGDFT